MKESRSSAPCCSGFTTTTVCCITSVSHRRSPADEKKALTAKLEKLIAPPGFTGNAPGGPSRWSTERSANGSRCRPKLVVEVSYDHFTGHRFRHGTKLLRWRPDKSPRQCTMQQVSQKTASLTKLLK